MSERNLTPGGRSHKILARLSRSDATARELFEALGYPAEGMTRVQQKKAWRLIDVLQADALIFRDDRLFTLLPAGAAKLEALNAITAVATGAPGVRVFRRAA